MERIKRLRNPGSTSGGFGAPLAIFLSAVVYFGFLYFNGILGSSVPGIVVQADIAVDSFLTSLRTPISVRLFSIVTAFGYWGVIFVLAATLSIILWLHQISRYIVGLWIGLVGNELSFNLLKVIFARPRPLSAYFIESSFSFPSGHAASSAFFFGYLIYLLVRERILHFGTAFAAGIVPILLIGASRLVLGEHFLSDVLNGYLVGGLWALFAIWFAERRPVVKMVPQPLPHWRRTAKFSVVTVAAVVVWLLVSRYQANLVAMPLATVGQ